MRQPDQVAAQVVDKLDLVNRPPAEIGAVLADDADFIRANGYRHVVNGERFSVVVARRDLGHALQTSDVEGVRQPFAASGTGFGGLSDPIRA